MKIELIDISKLKPHEKISKKRLRELKKKLLKEGSIKKPIIVEKSQLIILDGHHRIQLLKELNFKTVPAILVDYGKIRVFPRRKKYSNINLKNLVYETVKSGKLLPYKTTRHIFPFKDYKINNFNFKIKKFF